MAGSWLQTHQWVLVLVSHCPASGGPTWIKKLHPLKLLCIPCHSSIVGQCFVTVFAPPHDEAAAFGTQSGSTFSSSWITVRPHVCAFLFSGGLNVTDTSITIIRRHGFIFYSKENLPNSLLYIFLRLVSYHWHWVIEFWIFAPGTQK